MIASAGSEELAAGIVDQQVDAPEPVKYLLDEREDLVLLTDVTSDRMDVTVRAERLGLVQRLPAPAADDDMGAKRGKLQGDGAADARTSAGDDGHLAVEQTGAKHFRGHLPSVPDGSTDRALRQCGPRRSIRHRPGPPGVARAVLDRSGEVRPTSAVLAP